MRRWLLLLLCLIPACSRLHNNQLIVTPGMYADGPVGLHRLWMDILAACQRDERDRVHDLLASLAMTPDELASLLGPRHAQALWARYQAMMRSLANAGAIELVAHVYENKYDDIAVVRSDTLPTEQQSESDQQISRALERQIPFYTVRVKRKDETKGLRYEFFIYLGGRWRSGNLIGKYLGADNASAPVAPATQAPARPL